MKRKLNLNGLKLIQFGLFLFLGTVFLVACGSGGGGGTAGPLGQLAVSLTDDNDCNFAAAYVTVRKVRVHQSASASGNEAGWIDIVPPNAPIKVNLLTLQNGVTQDLGIASLPPGHYTQIRLYLVPNSGSTPPFNDYVTVGSADYPLNIPSGFASGIKLTPEFEIVAGRTQELILDFDPCRSISKGENGVYYLRPRILTILKADSGSIVGAVDAPDSRAVVKAEIDGHVYRQTHVRSDGSFVLYPLPNSDRVKTLYPDDTAGTFDVVIVSDTTATVLTTGVPVTVGMSTVLSTTTQPTALPPSAAGIVRGKIDPTNADARIRQTIKGKPYQIRRHSVDLVDGSFDDFILPVAPPRFGVYATTLPISYQDDAGAAAHYTIDTPNDDGLYKVSSQDITVDPTMPMTVNFTGANSLAPIHGTAGTVTGTITITSLPAGYSSGTILVSAGMDGENVNSIGIPISAVGSFPFTIDDLAPGTYTLTILSARGFTQILPDSIQVVIPDTGGTFSENNFTVSP